MVTVARRGLTPTRYGYPKRWESDLHRDELPRPVRGDHVLPDAEDSGRDGGLRVTPIERLAAQTRAMHEAIDQELREETERELRLRRWWLYRIWAALRDSMAV